MEVENMLFKKKTYLNWEQYTKKMDKMEHLLFLSKNFENNWRVIR
tara:strand:+ start:311 stop:445 length:135 start_codon:yes stop_codon:yes gene_type:complete